MGYCVFDIEVAPLRITNERIIGYMRSRDIEFNNPVFSKVVAAGVKEEGQEPVVFSGAEESILSSFWERVGGFFQSDKGGKIVTFNGYGFDVPFIHVRSALNGIKPTVRINTNPWQMENSNHFDCMLFISANKNLGWNSLEVTCLQLGIRVPEDHFPGELVASYCERGDIDSVVKHAKYDIAMTEELYRILAPGLLLAEPATDKQKNYMRSLGIPFDEDITKAEASKLIGEARGER
jgi:DNA polymerase elongation subunit (family B)